MMRLIVAATIVLFGISHEASASYTCDIANRFASNTSKAIDRMADTQTQASAAGLTMEQVKQAIEEFADFQQETFEQAVEMFNNGCRPGDQLTIPFPTTVRDLCDFNKNVVQHGDTTICIMRQTRP